jgi:restriction system protein
MAEITNQRKGELLQGIFKILMSNQEGLQAKTVLQKLSSIVHPTAFEAACYPERPTVRRFEKITRFSTIPAVKAGWLLKDKGLWSLTDEGRAAFSKYPDPESLYTEARRLYWQWKHVQPDVAEIEKASEESAESATALEEAEESAWSEVEGHLSRMNPYDFQNLVAGLLRGMGYHVVWIAPPGPDKGLDILAHTDPLGVQGPRIKVQVKRQSDKVNVQGIRSFMAILGEGDVGLFVNTGGFTKDAEDEARHQEKRRLMLIDLKRLFDLWVEHYQHIPEEFRRLLPLKAVYFLAPSE